MTLAAGTRLGPFEILAPIGAGGMGEVYRARDSKLNREVAIKVLPGSLSQDGDALSRFEREARAVAALNHPNILSIHDFGSHEGVAYSVTELLEGETLRDLVAGGALSIRKTVDFARQIAVGLAAAHGKGIVHRDLKPDNVFVTNDGRVKILDFGLAKETVKGGPGDQTHSPTVSAYTEPGTVMGTVGYMSPEQVKGLAVDPRSDIFSFGAVLFEMLTGKRAFQRDTAAETMTAILREEPAELSESRTNAPPALDRIVRHCLEKKPDQRFQSASDIAFALESAGDAFSSPSGAGAGIPPEATRGRSSLRVGWPVLLAAVIAAIAFALGRLKKGEPEVTWTGTLLGGPEIAMGPRISPDGHTLAFQAMVQENTQLAVMKPESGNWQVLTHRRGAGYVQTIGWALDGNRIYYDRTADVPMGIYSMPVLGGDEQLVLEDAGTPEPLPDGSLLLVKLNDRHALQLFRFWPESGRMQAFPLEFDTNYWTQARMFPDGKAAVALGRLMVPGQQEMHVYTIDLGSGAVRRVQTGISDDSIDALATTRDNAAVLVAAHSKDLTRFFTVPRKGGHPSLPLFTLTQAIHYMDCSADGSIYLSGETFRSNYSRFAAEGGRVSKIASIGRASFASLIPLADGRVIAAQLMGGRQRVVTLSSGKDPVPIASTNEETSPPVTTLGAGDLAFLIGPEPRRTIGVASLANGRVTRRIPFDKGRILSLASSPDGKTIYASAAGSIWAIPQGSQDPPRKICPGESVAADPDGKSLLVQVIEAPKTRLLRVPLDGGAPREIALNGPFHMTFDTLNSAEVSRDGRRLLVPLASLDSWFFVPGVIDLATGKMTRIPTDLSGDVHAMAWMPDGQVAAEANELRAEMWKFTPESK